MIHSVAKRLTDSQKDEITKKFIKGISLNQLSKEFGCAKLTISRNLRRKLGEDQYKNLSERNNSSKNETLESENLINKVTDIDDLPQNKIKESDEVNDFLSDTSFREIVPLDYEISNESRKEVSSIPIDEVAFPEIVFMIVDNKIELVIKLLKDYPEWQFLPEEDLNLKTIEIYSNLKDAKRDCKKDQKVIKVPNTNVFKIASKIIISRGISRIISDKKLIAL